MEMVDDDLDDGFGLLWIDLDCGLNLNKLLRTMDQDLQHGRTNEN